MKKYKPGYYKLDHFFHSSKYVFIEGILDDEYIWAFTDSTSDTDADNFTVDALGQDTLHKVMTGAKYVHSKDFRKKLNE